MIAAIIVTYNPVPEHLLLLLQRLAPQVDLLCIVDNSPALNDSVGDAVQRRVIDPDKLAAVRAGRNLGLASALNVGIDIALSAGADYLLLSDQDSLPAGDMVEKLVYALQDAGSDGVRVGAAGPVFMEINTDKVYPFQVDVPGKLFYGHALATAEAPIVDALTLITSGCLIPASVMREVGAMRDEYFVDGIDLEWCHRARAKGFRLIGVGGATMHHRMGEDSLRVWYLGWRTEAEYSPLRIYYRVRNLIALTRESYVDMSWKLRNSWTILGLIYSHLFFGDQRVASLRMSALGLWHGITGKMGAYEDHR